MTTREKFRHRCAMRQYCKMMLATARAFSEYATSADAVAFALNEFRKNFPIAKKSQWKIDAILHQDCTSR